MRTFCTIITSNYLPYAITLYRSILKINSNEKICVLVCDEGPTKISVKEFPNLQFHRLTDIFREYKADVLISKYNTNLDALRWSLKSVYIQYLLHHGFEKVIYTDCDVFFFGDYDFLFSELEKYNLLLTPGNTASSPFVHEEEFLSGYKYGLFNAGFIGAGTRSVNALKWWTNCCAYKIDTNFEQGLFVDQKYLDALPVLFENVRIIKHKGCNIAFWNQHECKRIAVNDEVLINGEYPIIFIHFTNKYIPELLSGNDLLIYPYYLVYEDEFKKSGKDIREFIAELPEFKKQPPILILKRKLLIRTRIKQWLFKLSQL